MADNVISGKLLTAQALGEKLSLSKRAIFRMRSAGLICAPLKVGSGAIRWRESEIEKWIELGCPDRKTFEARKEAEDA
jgi:predicted DNA-binding transcriptional regulator AlpA